MLFDILLVLFNIFQYCKCSLLVLAIFCKKFYIAIHIVIQYGCEKLFCILFNVVVSIGSNCSILLFVIILYCYLLLSILLNIFYAIRSLVSIGRCAIKT